MRYFPIFVLSAAVCGCDHLEPTQVEQATSKKKEEFVQNGSASEGGIAPSTNAMRVTDDSKHYANAQEKADKAAAQ